MVLVLLATQIAQNAVEQLIPALNALTVLLLIPQLTFVFLQLNVLMVKNQATESVSTFAIMDFITSKELVFMEHAHHLQLTTIFLMLMEDVSEILQSILLLQLVHLENSY
jgi:hypothetical protein